jgi:hypothetical protein
MDLSLSTVARCFDFWLKAMVSTLITAQRRSVVNRANSPARLAYAVVRDVLVGAAAHRASEPILFALVKDFHSPVARDAQALALANGAQDDCHCV